MGFNEAPPIQAGKLVSGVLLAGIVRYASMRPHLFRRGNYTTPIYHFRRNQASMRPHLFRRGNQIDQGDLRAQGEASMRPHLFRRGNVRFSLFPFSSRLSFNEAPPIQAGKLEGNQRNAMAPDQLQ